MSGFEKEELFVFFESHKVGRLWLDNLKKFIFEYDAIWIKEKNNFPLSYSLPIRKEPYKNDYSKTYFSNLLPEEQIKKLISGKFGISDGNDFGLLTAIGGDCAGAISLLPPDSLPAEKQEYEELSDQKLEEIIEQLPQRPLLAGEEGVRLSLAGAQNKIPLYYSKNKFFLPKGLPSSHILKPQIPQLPNTVENEAFCMKVAGLTGLSVPSVSIWSGKRSRAFIIERYDRKKTSDVLTRLHQEDFCQALRVPPNMKYQAEGGPSFKDCFNLIDHFQVPIIDKKRLISWVIFNYIIGNSDAHGKNISLFIDHAGFTLAPFYDIMCTQVYPTLYNKMAMKIDSENVRNLVMKRHWERFAALVGVKEKVVLDECLLLASIVPKYAESLIPEFVKEFGDNPTIHKIVDIVKQNANRLKINIAAS